MMNSPDETCYNSNFSELFYQKVASLRKLFGIQQDPNISFHKPISRTPKPASTRENSQVLPPQVKITRKRKETSLEKYRKYKPNPFSRNFNQSFHQDSKKIKIKKNGSSNSLDKKKISINLQHLPLISKSKMNLFADDDGEQLKGW
jgi:hypothetical protein